MPLRVLRFNEGEFTLSALDQSRLPYREGFNTYRDAYEVVAAIKEGKIRGSVLLGVVAAYAFTLEAYRNRNQPYDKFFLHLKLLGKELINADPISYNIVYMVNRLLEFVEERAKVVQVGELYKELLQEAKNIDAQESYRCERVSLNGLSLIKEGASILTYGNNGILFTGAIGTALGVIFKAYNRYNGRINIYISETRPRLEGMKLSCWEFSKTRLQFINICDNSAAYLFYQKKIDICIVGAERVCKNGDVINRIGTYNLAVLCKVHNVPFLVAFPSSTVDLSSEKADMNLIQPANQNEVFVVAFNGNNKVPKNYAALNYLHDITPSSFVTYYANENGLYKDFKKLLADLKKESSRSIKQRVAT